MINAYGVVSYNGYVFPATYNTIFKSKTIYGEDGFTPKYLRCELKINWIIATEIIPLGTGNASGTVDTAVAQIRQALMTPKADLIYNYQGMGTNLTSSAQTDMDGGPTPIDFTADPIATNRAVEATWIVQFNVPMCGSTQGVYSFFTQFNYQREFSLNESGCATITTTGTAEISNTSLNIDSYRASYYFQLQPGFRRVSQKFSNSRNRRVCNFIIVDSEIETENPLPAKTIDVDLKHSLSSSLRGSDLAGSGFLSWENSISGTITLAPGVAPITSYYLFLFYLRQRMYRIKTSDPVSNANTGVAASLPKIVVKDERTTEKQVKPRTILTRLEMNEAMTKGRTHSFRADYWALYNRDYLINQSGIFTPLYNYRENSGNQAVDWDQMAALDSEGRLTDYEPWTATFGRNTYSSQLAVQWIRYRNSLEYQQNGGIENPLYGPVRPYGYAGIFENNNDTEAVLFNPCGSAFHTAKVRPLLGNVTPLGNRFEPSGAENYLLPGNIDKTENDQSYIQYKTSFTLVEDHHTHQHVQQTYDVKVKEMLQSYAAASNSANPERTTAKFSVNNYPSNVSQQPVRFTHHNSRSNLAMVMHGYALRLGKPIPIPSVLAYNNHLVYRAGRAVYNQQQLNIGQNPIYLAVWSIPYYIDDEPSNDVFAAIMTTTTPGDMI